MEKEISNKRIFPRTDTECPVLYTIGSSEKWQVAMLINMAATGIKMKCNEQLLRNINITIMTKPGQNRLVPEITGKGKVVRCKPLDDGSFEVSCSLQEIKSSKEAS